MVVLFFVVIYILISFSVYRNVDSSSVLTCTPLYAPVSSTIACSTQLKFGGSAVVSLSNVIQYVTYCLGIACSTQLKFGASAVVCQSNVIQYVTYCLGIAYSTQLKFGGSAVVSLSNVVQYVTYCLGIAYSTEFKFGGSAMVSLSNVIQYVTLLRDYLLHPAQFWWVSSGVSGTPRQWI